MKPTTTHPEKPDQRISRGDQELVAEPYDETQVIKIVLHIDGTLLDVQFPPDSEETKCAAEFKYLLSSIQYGRAVCNPACAKGKTCRMVKVDGVYKARCVRP